MLIYRHGHLMANLAPGKREKILYLFGKIRYNGWDRVLWNPSIERYLAGI